MQRVVLITGATSGIGMHTANSLAAAGYLVLATGRSADRQAGMPLSVQYYQLDYTVQETIYALVELLEDRQIAIDVFINNAATISNRWDTERQCSENFLVNAKGPLILTELLLRHRLVRNIINMVSEHAIGAPDLSGMKSRLGLGGYFATKNAFFLTQYLIARTHGVHSCFFSPGAVASDLHAKLLQTTFGNAPRILINVLTAINRWSLDKPATAATALCAVCDEIENIYNHSLISRKIADSASAKVLRPDLELCRLVHAAMSVESPRSQPPLI